MSFILFWWPKMNYEFSVEGSAGNLYTIILKNKDGVFRLSCNCSAGIYNKKCKHKNGLIEDILNDKVSNVSRSEFMASKLYAHYLSYKEAEEALDMAKKRLKNVSASFEKVMAG